jgi:hypothetical protein
LDGGGINIYRNSNPIIKYCLIYSNRSSGGGGIYIWSESNPSIINCTIVNNSATQFNGQEGGAVWCANTSTFTMKNTIIFSNTEPEIEKQFNSHGGNLPLINIEYSSLSSSLNGAGEFIILENNIFENPQLNEDFTLHSTSPCIDAGDPNSPLDPDGTRADMGAYPFFHVYGCTDTQADNFDTEANTNDGSCMYRYSIPLQSGQNLVSFLELPEDNSISSTLSSVSSAQSVIAEGEAANFLNGIGWVGSLTTFSKEKGYWLKVNTNDQYSVLANNPPQCNNIAYNLQAGPNLISFPCPGQYSLNEAIPEELQPFITGIVGQGQAAIGNNGQFVGSLQYLEGSKGYWFIVTQDITLNFQQ